MQQTTNEEANLELKLIRRLPFGALLERLDVAVVRLMGRIGVPFLRIALGIVFFWFGALKLVPGASPAEDLVVKTVYSFLDPAVFVPFLAVWEMLIGLGLITGRFIRTTLLLLFLQMPGTALPLVMLPQEVYTSIPFGLTLEGQYIVKNLALIAAGFVIGSTVRGERPDSASTAGPRE